MQYVIVGIFVLAVFAGGMVIYQVANRDSAESFDWWYLAPVVLVVVGAVLLALEGEGWQKFKEDHSCKVVAKVSGSVFNTVGVSPTGGATVGVGVTPGKTGWLCDDGVTYYR